MPPLLIKGLGVVLMAVGGFLAENAGNMVKKVAKKGGKK